MSQFFASGGQSIGERVQVAPYTFFQSANTTKKKMKSFIRVQLFVTLWMVAYQAPPSMGFSKQEYWSGLPFPSPGNLHSPGIKPRFPALQADALLSEPPRKPQHHPTGLRSAHSPQPASLESTPMSLPFSPGCEHPEQGIEPVHHLYIP